MRPAPARLGAGAGDSTGSGALWLTEGAGSAGALVTKLTFSRTVERRRAAARSASCAVSSAAGAGALLDRLGPGVGRRLHLRRLRDRFGRNVGLHQRWRGLGRAAVEIGNRAGHFRKPASARVRPRSIRQDRLPARLPRRRRPPRRPRRRGRRSPLAPDRRGPRRAVRRLRPRRLRRPRRSRLRRLRPRRACASPSSRGAPPSRGSPRPRRRRRRLRRWPSPSPSPAAVFAAALVGQPFGLLGFDLGFGFDVERLVVVIGFLDLRREGGSLRRQQRLGGFQRVHLFAAVDDERLLAG